LTCADMGGPFDLWVQDFGIAARESLERSVDPHPIKTRLQRKRHMISRKKSNSTLATPQGDSGISRDRT
jgi:hypothetical protein